MYSYGSQPPLQLAIGDDFERMDANWNVGGFGGNLKVKFPHCACLLHWNGARKYWLDDGRYKDLVNSTFTPCNPSPNQKISRTKVQYVPMIPDEKKSKEEKQGWRGGKRKDQIDIEKKLSSQTVHLLYAADHDAMPGLDASVRSILKHASERVVIHHVGTEPLEPSIFSDVEFHPLADVHRIHNLTRFTNPHVSRHRSVRRLTSLANYVRFVMADMFPDVGKIMWIDADTIIRCDIVPFFRSALSTSNHTILARLMGGRPVEHLGK
ncbi:hypothetical protein THAOC_27868, partial [Thalassiosira oceanica]